MDKRFNTIY